VLRGTRRRLEIAVVDDQSRAPIAGAFVSLTPVLGKPRTEPTDAHGLVRFADLLPGEVSVCVMLTNYRRVDRKLNLLADRESPLETIALSRRAVIAGDVRWLVRDPRAAHVVLLPLDSDEQTLKTIERDALGWRGTFQFKDLKPGQYRLGLAGKGLFPSVEDVQRGAAEGWRIVDVRYRDDESVWLDVTQAMLDADPIEWWDR
jgi:hypothetical protein